MRTSRKKLVGVALSVVVVAACLVLLTPYWLSRLTLVGAYCLAVIGLNLVVGTTGQINLAQGAIFAVGAYTTAICRARYGISFPISLGIAALVSMILGGLVAWPAMRLRGHYLAVVTLGFSVAFSPVANRWTSLTGGSSGLTIEPVVPPAFLGVNTDQYIFIWAAAATIIGLIVAQRVVMSPTGIAMRAIKDNETAATAMGVDIRWVKLGAFVGGAAFAGIGGGLFASSLNFVAPENFTPLISMMLLVGVVVGGAGVMLGSLIGAVFLQFVPDFAASINKHLAGVFFGLAVIVCLRFMPGGPIEFSANQFARFKPK